MDFYELLQESKETLSRSANEILILLLILLIVENFYPLNFLDLTILAYASAAFFLIDTFLLDTSLVERLEMETRYVHGFLAFLVLAGLILRVWGLGVQSMWFDEALTANAAKGLLQTGKPVMPSGSLYWWGITSTLLSAVSAKILGFTDFALRLPHAVLGAATIPLVYLLGKDLFDQQVGIIAATFVTFLTWEIAWSRQARMYPLMQFLYTASIIMIYRVEKQFDLKNLGLLLSALLLGALTHRILYIMPVVAVAYLATTQLIDREISVVKASGIGTIGFVVSLIVARVGMSYSQLMERILEKKASYWPGYQSWLQNNISPLLTLGIVGAVLPFQRSRHREGILLLLSTIPALYIVSTRTLLFGTRYIYFLVPVAAVWTALAVDQIFNYTRKTLKQYGLEPEYLLILLTALIIAVGSFTLTPKNSYDLGVNAPQPDFKSAYNYLQPRLTENDTLIVGWSTPTYRYLGTQADYGLRFDKSGTGALWQFAVEEQITDAEGLRTVLNHSTTIWVVLDTRAFNRQDSETRQIVESLETVHTAKGIKVRKEK